MTPSPKTSALPVPPQDLDRSCRWVVLVLILHAVVWLVVGTALAALASFKWLSPDLGSNCPWLAYGRIYPAALNALVYGFALQLGLGLAFWLFCRLGRAPLTNTTPIVLAALLWNLGTLLGCTGILAGDSTGYAWLEMPSYAASILFCAYLVLALGALLAFNARREPALYVSQWYLLAALLWFPWIFSAAQMWLVLWPGRGVVQAAVNTWFAANLFNVCLASAGLAAIFYFIPKVLGRTLFSGSLAGFGFWSLVFLGGWGGFSASLPLPRWMLSLSSVADTLLLIPLVAVAVNLHKTMTGRYQAVKEDATLRFVNAGLLCWLLAGLMQVAGAQFRVSELTEFTLFSLAKTCLWLFGFCGMTGAGAVYYLVPRLARQSLPCLHLARIHLLASLLGLPLLVLSLAIGGLVQGAAYNDHRLAFGEVVKTVQPYLLAAAVGLGLLAVAQLAFVFNLALLLKQATTAALRRQREISAPPNCLVQT